MSLWVLSVSVLTELPFLLNSPAASPMADFITPNYPYYSGSGNPSDSYVSGVFCKYLFGRHLGYRAFHTGVHEIYDLGPPDEIHQRDYYQPYEEASAAYYQGIFQTDYVAQTQNCGSGVELEYQLGLFGDCFTERKNPGRDCVAPQPESRYYEIIQSSDKSADKQGPGAFPSAFSAYQNLCGGRGFRERVLAVHFLYEIFPERNQEKNAEHASQKGREEHFGEIHCHFRIFCL